MNQATFTTKNKGLVPASTTNTSAYLRGDGTWSTPKDATVSQTLQNTANAEYPLLLGAAGQSATKTGGVYFDSNITVNPNTNTITATTFKGKAADAVKADSATRATQDGNGSEIATSYVKKGTLATVATTGSYNDLSGRPSNATTTVSGFMSASDKTKLDSLSKDVATANANGLMSATDKAKFNTISTWYDGITGTDSDDVINKWSEVTSFLSGIKDTNTLNGLIGAVETKVETLKSDIQNGTVVANKATVATKVGTTTVGSSTQPVYLSGGIPSACTYSLNKTVPSDAVFTDTHHTAKNVVSNSANATANKAATNGNVHINLVENNTCRSGIKIVGSGATTVSCDGSGNITILSNDTNTTYSPATSTANGLLSSADKIKLDSIANSANAYSLPNATSTVLGGVKIGSNISVNSGTISLTKSNVTSALGYTPPTTNTTYSVATTSANGLMSSSWVSKMNRITVTPDGMTAIGEYGIPTKGVYVYATGIYYTSDNNTLNTVLHTGNIGSQKAGDSSKLGGVAASSYATKDDITNGNITASKATTADSANAIGGKGLSDLVQGGGTIKFIKVVTSLPASPSSDTLYLIK
jgi:hypothetical protein